VRCYQDNTLEAEDYRVKKQIVVHPILFAVFPVLFLLAHNVGDFPVSAAARPMAIAAAIAGILWAGLRLATGSWPRAALIVSLFIVLATSSTHAANKLWRMSAAIAGANTAGPRTVAVVMAVFAAVTAVMIARTKRDLAGLTKVLNVASACLLAVPVFTIAGAHARELGRRSFVEMVNDPPQALVPTKAPAQRPHIFYIVLDGYSRPDNLADLYGRDDSDFTRFLASRGFKVAPHATSNYAFTFASIASTLNMRYLDDISAPVNEGVDVHSVAIELVRHNRVRSFLAGQGYKLVSFMTGFYATEIKDADMLLGDPWQLGEFEEGIIRTAVALPDSAKMAQERRRVLYEFEKLPELARSDRPLFVIAHIMCPHPPYVFGEDGGPSDLREYYWTRTGDRLINRAHITRSQDKHFYLDQLSFANRKAEEAIDGILANSKVDPIIILQADHGHSAFLDHRSLEDTYLADRMSILAAYHLPMGGNSIVYDAMTPVNSFRLILNRYFGTSLTQLPDKNYFLFIDRPSQFVDVTMRIGSPSDRLVYERLKNSDYFDLPADGSVAVARASAAE
jgi:hypothetical protein